MSRTARALDHTLSNVVAVVVAVIAVRAMCSGLPTSREDGEADRMAFMSYRDCAAH